MDNLKFEAIAIIGEETAVAVSFAFNGLFKVNIKTGLCEYMGMIPNEKYNGRRLYTIACLVEKKVYFIPYTAKEIAVYDVVTQEIYKMKFDSVEGKAIGYKANHHFNGAVVYGDYIFLVPCTYPAIVRIDTRDNILSYFAEWRNDEGYLFRKAVEVDGDIFYVPSTINNLVLAFNMKDCLGKLHHVGNNNRDAGVCVRKVITFGWLLRRMDQL